MEARLIIDGHHSGPWNMAADEVLWQASLDAGLPTLRFYQWSEPWLSLGYFQRAEERSSHPPSAKLPFVRRISGGGAILHHFELTYCLVLPPLSCKHVEPTDVYEWVHQAAVDVLSEQAVTAHIVRPTPAPAANVPFLCFHRRAAHDVCIGVHKVLGSAQRRRHATLLQHGSLILKPSPFAPDILGTSAAGDHLPDDADFWIARWSDHLARRLGWRWTVQPWSEGERQRIESLAKEKYSSDAWNLRR
jgi:lipoate-protein ligase A